MTEHDVISVIMRGRYVKNFCLPRFSPAHWWECDVFQLTKAGYFNEYEVKLSRSDFKADAHKSRREWVPSDKIGPMMFEDKTILKHGLLAARSTKGPVKFWYVTPEGLLTPSDIPEWAGHIEIVDTGESGIWRYLERDAKSAPRLHNVKMDEKIRDRIRDACYWRMHRLMQKIGTIGDEDQPAAESGTAAPSPAGSASQS